jgi:dUTP diphosphatase
VKLRVQRHYPDMPLPAKGHAGDAGFDLTAMAVEALRPRVFAFDTGISVQPEAGYYCEVVPRSSMVKTEFLQANSVGIIDPDYRGRIRVVLRYAGAAADGGVAEAQSLLGTRIAQLLVRRLEPVALEPAEALEETARGAGGFGSTGR